MTTTGLWFALQSYYRDSNQKGSRWSLKPRSNIRDFTDEMPFKALYQCKRIADWSINVRTNLIDVKRVVVVDHFGTSTLLRKDGLQHSALSSFPLDRTMATASRSISLSAWFDHVGPCRLLQ